MNFLTLLVLSVIIVAIAVAGLAIAILIKKGGRFPNTHIDGNKQLNKRGISCIQTWDRAEQAKAKEKIDYSKLTVDKNSRKLSDR